MSDKQLALARKEGGKKGQDILGLSEMGGVVYFHVVFENCNGDWDLMEAAMQGANASVDENADERKGGAGGIAKAFLSASDSRLCIYVDMPESLSNVVSLKEWFDVLVQASGATVVQEPTNGVYGFAKAEVNKAPEVFPLKLRDQAIGLGFAFLKSKGVIPDDDDSSVEMEEDIEW